mmetsp:Transcript_12252/g.27010  ORF Transcript_12252/g.27010 Transcript_12252/m.27010 type:complete len:421 (-) Transcript_12252:389-1651(-)
MASASTAGRVEDSARGATLSSDEEGGDDGDSSEGEEEFDAHGFALPPQGDTLGDSFRRYAAWFEAKAQRRRGRFEKHRTRLPASSEWVGLPKKRLKALLRKGLPQEHRREVWISVLGVEERRKRSNHSYEEIRARAKKEIAFKTGEEIERDLQRTFPNHRRFRGSEGQGQLRNVLTSYAIESPRVQYCQGLNFIAALLLIVMEDEDTAFWALVCAIDTLGVERYYTEGMTLLRADMRALSSLMQKKCPKVARHLATNGIDVMAVCSEWFITWYAKCMPISTTLRVWDTLFYEGFKVLFRVAVGVFKRVENDILKCPDFDDLMEQAKDWPRGMVQHNELLKASFKGIPGLKRKDLLKARDDALCAVEREDEEQQKRLAEHRQAKAAAAAAAAAAKAAVEGKQSPSSPGPTVPLERSGLTWS